MLESLPHPEDHLLAEMCLEGDRRAIQRFQEKYQGPLLNYLLHAGAKVELARVIVAEMLADCLAERRDRKPRLATYSGNAPLLAWLKAVALNKLLQVVRQEERQPETIVNETHPETGTGGSILDAVPDGSLEATESPLLEIMRCAVETAFRECDPEDFVLVHLAHTNELRGRELAVMFACVESTISRKLDDARRKIEEATMRHVRARDPWLELRWEDFVELCRVVGPSCFGVE